MSGYMPAQALLKDKIRAMPAFQDTYTASTISFDATAGKILDSANGLAWVGTGGMLTVTGSGANDGTYTVTESAAGYATVSEALVDEAEGAGVTLSKPPCVTEGDYRVLDSGVTNSCVLFAGEVPQYDTAGMTRVHLWECSLELYRRYTDDVDFYNFGILRDSLIIGLDNDPVLSDDYFIMTISSAGVPEKLPDTSGPVIGQTLRISIQENV